MSGKFKSPTRTSTTQVKLVRRSRALKELKSRWRRMTTPEPLGSSLWGEQQGLLGQNIPGPLLLALQGPFWGSSLGPSPAPSQDIPTAGADSTPSCRLGEEMEDDNRMEPWHRSLQAMLDALNQMLHGAILRPATPRNTSARAGWDNNAYMYILFVMTHFAATVGSLILGYTRSRKVDKRSDPYHVYIKNRVSMI
uniref:Potassium voltage-gated channel subfamily E member 3 n=1 Tax=Anser cygnoides TaxID=8845 RepID=A0A8B9DV99_ANSCY|nr:uncharacterized protein LOC125180867 isoform X1 [Anser cygnoides]